MQIILFIFYFIATITAFGFLLIKLFHRSLNILTIILTGFVGYFAVFEVIALPFILLKGNFLILCYTFGFISLGITILSLVFLCQDLSIFKYIFVKRKRNLHQTSLKSTLPYIIFGSVLFFQLFIVTVYAHFDADDSFYIAISNACISSNQIFGFEHSTGLTDMPFPASYSLTGYEVLVACWSKVFSIQPVVLYHTVLPIIFIPISYLAFYCLSKRIIKNKTKSIWTIIILSALNIFSNYSVYSPGAFLLFRSWQGKTSLVNILFPALLYFFVCAVSSFKIKQRTFNLFCCTLILLSSVCFSSVGIYLLPIAFFCLVVAYSVYAKKLLFLFRASLNAIPSFLFLLLFLVILNSNNTFDAINNIVYEYSFLLEIKKFFNENYYSLFLYLVSILYLIFKGTKLQKFLFLCYPLLLIITFLNPLFMPFVAKYLTGAVVYWRLFWLLPIYLTISLTLVLILSSSNLKTSIRILCGFLILPLFLPTNFIFNSNNYTFTGNMEKLPDEVINFCKEITDKVNNPIVLSPPEYCTFIRQYSGTIKVVWTRETYVSDSYYALKEISEFQKLSCLYYNLYIENTSISEEELEHFQINTIIFKNDNPSKFSHFNLLENDNLYNIYYKSI